ncbi:Hypothetical protein PHPALM_13791 [Phytophthora palmivora]|uniref:Uncharacterized protein n=1 Tax=Phytophthora palmivora TaxID=4796 RepID=A0A2P4XWG3_9STRA|nr:Hypothetical protein PHPALM_13791 [Phytophthora palmivora]
MELLSKYVPNKQPWRDLVDTVIKEELILDLPLGLAEEGFERCDHKLFGSVRLAEVETVDSMRFDPSLEIEAPSDLYECSDNSITTRLLPEYSHLIALSATSGFIAYIPVYAGRKLV